MHDAPPITTCRRSNNRSSTIGVHEQKVPVRHPSVQGLWPSSHRRPVAQFQAVKLPDAKAHRLPVSVPPRPASALGPHPHILLLDPVCGHGSRRGLWLEAGTRVRTGGGSSGQTHEACEHMASHVHARQAPHSPARACMHARTHTPLHGLLCAGIQHARKVGAHVVPVVLDFSRSEVPLQEPRWVRTGCTGPGEPVSATSVHGSPSPFRRTRRAAAPHASWQAGLPSPSPAPASIWSSSDELPDVSMDSCPKLEGACRPGRYRPQATPSVKQWWGRSVRRARPPRGHAGADDSRTVPAEPHPGVHRRRPHGVSRSRWTPSLGSMHDSPYHYECSSRRQSAGQRQSEGSQGCRGGTGLPDPAGPMHGTCHGMPWPAPPIHDSYVE